MTFQNYLEQACECKTKEELFKLRAIILLDNTIDRFDSFLLGEFIEFKKNML